MPATISLTASSPLIMAGEDLILTCSITLPRELIGTPSFSWTGPEESHTAAAHQTHDRMFVSTLMVNSILPADGGMYNCTAILGGSLTESINVTVSGENETLTSLASYSISYNNSSLHYFSIVSMPNPFVTFSPLTAGTASNFTCNYTLSPFPVEASATWTLNEVPISGHERISTDGITLIFSKLTTVDSGSYKCTLNITSLTPHVIIDGDVTMTKLDISVPSRSLLYYNIPF